MLPDFLAIGHVARDIIPEGNRIGGSAPYAAVTAQRLGLDAAVVTRAKADIDLRDLRGIDVHNVASPETTTFENRCRSGARSLSIRAVAGPITASHVPDDFRRSPLILLAPIARELDGGLARQFPDATVGASIQGWLRQWGADGLVRSRTWTGTDVLPHLAVAVLSSEDAAAGSIDAWKALTPVLAVTEGSLGSRVHFDGSWHAVSPHPTREVDSMGAGDVYAAAFLIRLRETGDCLVAANFASCAASFSVESPGLEGIATRVQVDERLEEAARRRIAPAVNRQEGDS